MPLNAAEVQVLSRASSQELTSCVQRSLRNINHHRWLSSWNRYRVSTIQSIRTDLDANRLNSNQLGQYIGASAALHCCDGWSYLGRAIGCHLHGDPDTARHLGYYAELRATMALLATQGVGIFNNRHFIINNSGTAELLSRRSTHEVVWLALESWAQLPDSGDLLGEILRPAGRPVRDWLDAMPSGASWQPIATQWLLQLGLDLRVMSKDHDARNEASYRPTRLSYRPTLTSTEAASAVVEMWELLEPVASQSFSQIDRYLLRLTVEAAFQGTTGSSPRQAPKRFAAAVNAVVGANISAREVPLWEHFLKRATTPQDPNVIKLIKLSPHNVGRAVGEARHHLAVMGRALLLLRLASGATRRMLVNAGVAFDDLTFWWEPYGMSRGLWEQPPAAMNLTDGWADTEAQLSGIIDWLERGVMPTYYKLLSEVPWSFAGLTSLELVGLWSLAS